jgi:heme a synthase
MLFGVLLPRAGLRASPGSSTRSAMTTGRRLFRASAAVLTFTVAVILWGAFVRASGSGDGCGSHWPVCNGVVIPLDPSTKTLIEYSHRLTSGLDLLAVLALAVAAFRVYPKRHAVRFWAVASLGFILLEAALGAGLVLLELVAKDASVRRALAMSLHLTNTFLLLAALTAVTFHTWVGNGALRWRGAGVGWLVGALGMVVLAGASGGVAALGDTLSQHGVTSPLVAVLLQLRILHPVFAVAAVLVCGAAASASLRRAASNLPATRALAILLVAQVFAGIANVALQAPVWMQLVHLLLADAVWVALVWMTRTTLLVEGTDPTAAPTTEPLTREAAAFY